MKTEFPMPWKKALREIFGGRTEGDRTNLFRSVWRSQLQRMTALERIASADNTNEIIAKFKREGMSADWLARLRIDFAEWRAERDRTQRRNAANSRWKKTFEEQTAKKVLATRRNARK